MTKHKSPRLTQEQLDALSTLVAFSWESEQWADDSGFDDTADDIARARDTLRTVLHDSGTWLVIT